jgi:hypothetical protein
VNSIRTRLTVAAGVVIIALTGAAFWLSYAHLHDVAAAHGLGNSPMRAWAWPATLDLFIVAGEIMMLVAALAKRRDPWAIGLTVAGSFGSIGLNVYGVGGDAPKIEYLVAAVPPAAALLAFGALMRQVHHALAGAEDSAEPVVNDQEELADAQAPTAPLTLLPEAQAPALAEVLADEEAVHDVPEEDDAPEEEPVPVYTISTKPTVEEIDAAVRDLRQDGLPLSGERLGQYFGVSARTGRRYLSQWTEAQEATA